MTNQTNIKYNPYVKGIYCQKCGSKRSGMVCQKCGYPFVVIRFEYEGRRYRLYNDSSSRPWTYSAAEIAKRSIDDSILDKTFDEKQWTREGVEERRFQNSFEEYLGQKEKKVRPSTMHVLNSYYRNHYQYFYGMDAREIKLKHLQRWYDNLPATLSTKYKKNLTDCLRSFFSWLVRWGSIKEMPVMPEIQTPDSIPRQALDYTGQLEALKNIPEEHRDIFEFMTETGLRPGEACALRARDIDFLRRAMLVQRTYSKHVIVESTKGRHKMWVPLSDRAQEIVNNNTAIKTEDNAFLFINGNTRGGYKPETLRKIWRKYSGSDVDLYSATRHSFCTQLVELGVSEIEAQGLMRHKDARSTRHYYHPTQERQREFLNKRTSNVIELKKKTG